MNLHQLGDCVAPGMKTETTPQLVDFHLPADALSPDSLILNPPAVNIALPTRIPSTIPTR